MIPATDWFLWSPVVFVAPNNCRRENAVVFLMALALTIASSALPVAAQPAGNEAGGGTLEVWGLSFTSDVDGKAKGHCFPIKVTVSHQGGQAFRVGVFESEVGGGGPNWRASGWMAAMIAAQIVGFDPANTQISFDVAGHVDGPSAGGLITVGTMAALRGDTIRSDAAMTGAINPDGTIGPVGGIPQKIEGAAAAGKKLVLIPADVRLMEDVNQKKQVDLVEHGKNLGLTVVPVSNIYDAYQLLTDRPLPRPPKAGHPELSPVAYEHNERKTREWAVRANVALEQYKNLPDTHKYEFTIANSAAAEGDLKRVENLLNEGEPARAYQSAIEAANAAMLSLEAARLNETYQTRTLDQAAVQVKALGSATSRLDLLVGQLKRAKPKTVGQLAVLINAHIVLDTAIAQSVLARQLLEEKAADDDQRLTNVFSAHDYYHYALLNGELAKDYLEEMPLLAGRALDEQTRLPDVADLFLHAAQANENVLDQQVIEEVARTFNKRAEAVRAGLMRKDLTYALNRLTLRAVLPSVVKELGAGPAADLARLSAAVEGYGGSSLLLAKYVTLKADLDDDLNVQAIQYEKSLQNMIDTTEDQLRRSIQALTKHDIDATTCIEYYQIGRMYRDRSQVAKLDALNMYWRGQSIAWALSQIAGVSLPK